MAKTQNKASTKSTAKIPDKARAGLGSKNSTTDEFAGKERGKTRRKSQSIPAEASRPISSQNGTQHEESSTMMQVMQKLKEMEGRFVQERMEKEKLEAFIEELRDEGMDKDTTHLSPGEDIPRPSGTCGKDWGLQIEMGLSGSPNKDAKYAALLRGVRDLVLNAGLDWESGWKEISASEKSKVFQVARKRYPILQRYVNDWATAEMVKQYIKNKRAHCYRRGWLEVPEKYSYLKKNSSKRDPTASRVKRAKTQAAAEKKAKRMENSKVHREKAVVGKAKARGGTQDGGDREESEWPEDLPE